MYIYFSVGAHTKYCIKHDKRSVIFGFKTNKSQVFIVVDELLKYLNTLTPPVHKNVLHAKITCSWELQVCLIMHELWGEKRCSRVQYFSTTCGKQTSCFTTIEFYLSHVEKSYGEIFPNFYFLSLTRARSHPRNPVKVLRVITNTKVPVTHSAIKMIGLL